MGFLIRQNFCGHLTIWKWQAGRNRIYTDEENEVFNDTSMKQTDTFFVELGIDRISGLAGYLAGH